MRAAGGAQGERMSTFKMADAIAYNAQRASDPAFQRALALLVARWQEQGGLALDGKLGPSTIQSVRDLLDGKVIPPDALHADHGDAPDDDAPIALDADGWAAGADVHVIPSPRSQALVHRDGAGAPAPAGIVWHWTATGPGTAWACARRIALPPKPGERAASWHVLISRKGEVLQSVPLRRGAWHTGGTTAKRFARKSGAWVIDPAGTV